ncbi:MAG: tetratricopeptide repeat protein [Planctomycetota bacterium]|jgi:tetratricopeptide (TPR) repeat protein
MDEINIEERFPDMEPVSSPPSLGRLNGFGFGMYGRRDMDTETGTYVSTQAFSALWIPIFAMRAYRVADAESGGWYFIGRVPLSSTAKMCNILVLVGALIFGGRMGWSSYQSRPDVRAGNEVARAEQAVEEGRIADAARIYQDVGAGQTKHAAPARRALLALVRDRLTGVAGAEAEAVVRAGVALQRRFPSGDLEGLRGAVVAAAGNRAEEDPGVAIRLLDAVTDVGESTDDERSLRRKLLEQLVKTEPDNIEHRSALALLCEAADELDRCRELLEPHRAKLGDSEGARILGQLEARDGNLDAALALLEPYVKPRLKVLRSTETTYDRHWEQRADEELAKLNRGSGPDRFYSNYERADEAGKQRLVDEYLGKILERDWELAGELAAWRAATAVVPAALDLGIVHLRRGQQMADPDRRKAELLEAEKIFLATRAASGETDTYRLFLGQVYYWLGREADGKKLFDQLLEANGRSAAILMQLCHVLRELGAFAEACKLADEAYGKETDAAARYAIAMTRAMSTADTDEEIEWLEKSDPNDGGVRAALSSALGDRAYGVGMRAEAARHFRAAIDAYESLPPTVGTLHNGAGACMRVMNVEFDPAILDRAIDLYEKAHKADPDSAIVMSGLAGALWERAIAKTIGEKIEVRALQIRAERSLLSYLFRDQKGRDVIIGRLRQHRDVRRARQMLEQALVVAPRSESLVSAAVSIELRLRDAERLARILDSLRKVAPDTAQSRAGMLQRFTDERLAESRALAPEEAKRRAEILAALPASASPESKAVGRVMLLRQLVWNRLLGIEVDPAEITRLAEQAHAEAPSSATETAYVDAELYAAHVALLAARPAYRKTAKRLRTALDTSGQIAAALEVPGALRSAVAAHPAVKRAADRIREQAKTWPTGTSFQEWAVLRAVHPDDAKVVARALAKDKIIRLGAEIGSAIWWFHPSGALDAYFWYRILGDEKAAMAAIAKCREGGAPTPFGD